MSGSQIRPSEDRFRYGMLLVLLAYWLFSHADATVKWLGLAGYSAVQIAFMRYLPHAVISVAKIGRPTSLWQQLKCAYPFITLFRASMLLGQTLCNFYALAFLPLTLTSTILFATPILVTILSQTVLGERVGPWRWGAIMFGFVGVLIAIRPFGEDFHWAALISLLGSCCFAVYLMLTRYLVGKVSSNTMQLYVGLVGTLALLPWVFISWQTPASIWHWLMLLVIGLLAWIGHELLTRAYRYAEASALTPYTYSFMIYLAIWSIVLYDHYPDKYNLIGATIVILSGLIIWWRENRNRKKG